MVGLAIHLVRLGAWASLLALLGCAAAPEGEAELMAGSAGDDGSGFVAVDDGAEVELIPGSQGGFHVWLGVGVQGVTGKVYLQREARRVSDDVLVFRGIPQALDLPADAMDGWWEAPTATPAFMCPSPIGVKVYDEELVFDVWLTDGDDAVLARDQLLLLPRCPDGEQAAFCQSICAG